MAKNYMADVANMLGVELEEEFTVPNKVATLKISAKDGLMCKFIEYEYKGILEAIQERS